MKRRKVLLNIAVAAGGLVVLPMCSRWGADIVQSNKSFLTSQQENLLAEIVETII